jgi:hypothetical protein
MKPSIGKRQSILSYTQKTCRTYFEPSFSFPSKPFKFGPYLTYNYTRKKKEPQFNVEAQNQHPLSLLAP